MNSKLECKNQRKEISIFRTSVNSKCKIETLTALLNEILGHKNWNFDLDDHENILRVYSFPNMNNFLANEINKIGFDCVELF